MYLSAIMTTHHYDSLKDFYPYYLSQHRDFRCRLFHFIGTALVICLFAIAIASQRWVFLLAMPVAGYGLSWMGHFIFEKNKPAAFSKPLFSLACDFIMFWHIITGQIGTKMKAAERIYPQTATENQ